MAATLRIEGDLTVVAAAQQREALLQALAGAEGELVLDLGDVQAIDSAGVQLLLATRRSLAETGGSLSLRSPSRVVIEALQVYHLHALLPTPPKAA
ncbi:MAG: STAS domain-containing protein [Burkholderiales bacterium]|nr:STAS domain-containing protein [Burkholderiales bacterium]